jgi:hypothetical protein
MVPEPGAGDRFSAGRLTAMELDLERVRKNVERATTEDLLDRATVYRAGMEPDALRLIIEELGARGVSAEAVAEHEAARMRTAIMLPDGTARPCSFCDRPAAVRIWGWHRMWGKLPVFPRVFSYCEVHTPPARPAEKPDAEGA